MARLAPAAAAAGQRSICGCADDFGLQAAIDGAVLELVAAGRLHAAGVMVGAIAARGDRSRATAALRELAGCPIDLGLHLDLTEAPLLRTTRPRRWSAVAVDALLDRLDTAAVDAEIAAQLDAFEQAVGAAPAFVDGHQHVHQLPGVRDALLDRLARSAGRRRCWLRSGRCPPGAGFKARVVQALGAGALERLARRGGHGHNGRLLGVYDFGAVAPGYAQRLAGWLHAAQDADLLMCHPALAAGCDGGAVDDPIAAARRREHAALAGPAFAALLRRERIALAPMSAILAAAAVAPPAAHQP